MITTYSLRTLDLLNPKPEQIDIEDIAKGLSREYRWANQSRKNLTVAEHSVIVAERCSKPFPALMHDATEAFLRDLPKTVKDLLPGYKEIECRLLLAICQKFEIAPHDMFDGLGQARKGFTFNLEKEIHQVDCEVGEMESEYIMTLPSEPNFKDHSETFKCLEEGKAYQLFMEKFHHYAKTYKANYAVRI